MSFSTSESLQEGAHMCIHMCEHAAGWWRGKTLEYPLASCLPLSDPIPYPSLTPSGLCLGAGPYLLGDLGLSGQPDQGRQDVGAARAGGTGRKSEQRQ